MEFRKLNRYLIRLGRNINEERTNTENTATNCDNNSKCVTHAAITRATATKTITKNIKAMKNSSSNNNNNKSNKSKKRFLTVERPRVLSSFTVETKIKIQNSDASSSSSDVSSGSDNGDGDRGRYAYVRWRRCDDAK